MVCHPFVNALLAEFVIRNDLEACLRVCLVKRRLQLSLDQLGLAHTGQANWNQNDHIAILYSSNVLQLLEA